MKSKFLTILFIPDSGGKQKQVSISILALFLFSLVFVLIITSSIIVLFRYNGYLESHFSLKKKYSNLLKERLLVNELLEDLNKIKYLDKQVRKNLIGDMNMFESSADSFSIKVKDSFLDYDFGSMPVQIPLVGYLTQKIDLASEFKSDNHYGIDISATEGSPILASSGGMVVFTGWNNDLGNHIILYHGDGYFTKYGHLNDIIHSERDLVSAGDLIAFLGSTGLSSGPHLHFEIWRDGVILDPLDFFPQYKNNDLSLDFEK